MATYEYAIAIGFNASTLTNIEDLIDTAPASQPLPAGSVVRKTMDRVSHVNGAQMATWEFAALSYDDFYILSQYFGQAVTVTTRDGVRTFATFNAYVNLPQPGDDYRLAAGGVEGLRMTLDTIARLEPIALLLLESGDHILLEDFSELQTE
jgi:hypothetical protein